jgi:6-pyruvoyltetrahydropterin/6-carboxytetrahydropterin synthase
MKHSISISHDFEYGHRLLNYNGNCSHIHGHHGIVEIQVSGSELNELGMVIDFSDLKRNVQRWIDSNMDHGCLLHKEDTEVIAFFRKMGFKTYVMESNPTAENISKEIWEKVEWPEGLKVDFIRVWETPDQYAEFLP